MAQTFVCVRTPFQKKKDFSKKKGGGSTMTLTFTNSPLASGSQHIRFVIFVFFVWMTASLLVIVYICSNPNIIAAYMAIYRTALGPVGSVQLGWCCIPFQLQRCVMTSKSLEDAMSACGVDPATASHLVQMGWTIQTFAFSAVTREAFDKWWPEPFSGWRAFITSKGHIAGRVQAVSRLDTTSRTN